MTNPDYMELLAALKRQWQDMPSHGKLIVRAKLRGMERRARRLERVPIDDSPVGTAKSA